MCSVVSFSFIKDWSSTLCFLDFLTALCVCMSLVLLWQCLVGYDWIPQSSGMSSVTSCSFNCYALYCQNIIYLRFASWFTFLLMSMCLPACCLSVCQDCCASPGGWRSIWFIYPSCLVQPAASWRPSERWWRCREAGALEVILKQSLRMLYPLGLSWKEKLKLIVS